MYHILFISHMLQARAQEGGGIRYRIKRDRGKRELSLKLARTNNDWL